MSSYFQPPYKRRKPPPQCKKTKPNPLAPPAGSDVGSLAGTRLLLDWTWSDRAPTPLFTFRQRGYVTVDSFNTVISIDGTPPTSYAEVVWVWQPSFNTWIISCDLFYAGVYYASAPNVHIPYTAGVPFSIIAYNYPLLNIQPAHPTMLTFTITV